MEDVTTIARVPAATASARWRRHVWLAYLIGSLAAAVVYATGSVPHLYEAVAVGSAFAILAGRSLWRPASGRSWVLAAGGIGCWAAADIVWNVLDSLGGTRFPSVADGILVDDRARAVTAATIAMARSLGALTVAEGVETAAQRDELVRLGCDVSQGYLVSRPLPPSEATAVVRAHCARQPLVVTS